jgi:putative membrane protein
VPPDSDWERLHPLTPLLRGGRALIVVVGFAAQDAAQGRTLDPQVYLVLALAGALLTGGGGYLSWRRRRFRIDADAVELVEGVLFRRRRRLPLARVEGVDLLRPLVARVLGLAEVRVESVSGGDSEVVLSYLPEQEAEAVRARVLALRPGEPVARTEHGTGAAAERVLVTVPLGPLVTTALLVPVLCLAVAAVAAVVVGVVAGPLAGAGVLLSGVVAVVPLVLAQAARVERAYGTTLAEAPEGLRVRRGLINLRAQTVPLARVQAVRLEQPLLWRRWDWVRVVVDVAGYRGQGQETSELLPVAPRGLAVLVATRVLPGLDLAAIPLTAATPAARWRAPIGWRALSAGLSQTHVVTTRGRWRRQLEAAPHPKVQSWRVVQGPWQRRLGLATLLCDTAGSSITPAARHQPLRVAHALLRSSRAAAAAVRER